MAKKLSKEKARCADCKYSTLTQWDNNPVIAQCPHQLYRQVANSLRLCQLFEPSQTKKQITKYSHLNN